MEEMSDVIVGMDAMNVIRAQIGDRQAKRRELWEKIIDLDGQIAGLREAEHQIEKLPGHCVALSRQSG